MEGGTHTGTVRRSEDHRTEMEGQTRTQGIIVGYSSASPGETEGGISQIPRTGSWNFRIFRAPVRRAAPVHLEHERLAGARAEPARPAESDDLGADPRKGFAYARTALDCGAD